MAWAKQNIFTHKESEVYLLCNHRIQGILRLRGETPIDWLDGLV
jgi:hypothetical protein